MLCREPRRDGSFSLEIAMSPVIRHCPKCAALQPDQAQCGVCGAPMAGSESMGAREILSLAGPILGFLGAFVLLAIILVSALVAILH
jgi:hypothetical protein